MSQYLPYSNLRLETETTFETILNTPDNNDTGEIEEVDFGIPQSAPRHITWNGFATSKHIQEHKSGLSRIGNMLGQLN